MSALQRITRVANTRVVAGVVLALALASCSLSRKRRAPLLA